MTMAETLSPGMTVDAGAAPAGRSAARRRHRIRRSRCAAVDRARRSRIDHTALASRADRSAVDGRCADAVGARRRAASVASRSRAFSDTRNSGACRSGFRRTRWCRVRKRKRSSRPRSRAVHERRERARCASPISAPAPARSCSRCCTNCRMPSASEPIAARARSPPRAPMPTDLSSQIARRSWLATFRRALRGRFDLVVSNPPYIASGDIDASATDVRRPRSASGAGWRRGRPCRLSRDRRRCRPSARADGGRLWSSLAVGQTRGRFGRHG